MTDKKVIDAEFEESKDDKPSNGERTKGLFNQAADVLDRAAGPVAVFDMEKGVRAKQIAEGLRNTADDAAGAVESAGELVRKGTEVAKKIGSFLGVSQNEDRPLLNLERK